MSALGDLVQEQREEDRRGREEDTRRVIDAEEVARAARARAAWKAAKRPNERPVSSTARRAHPERKRLGFMIMVRGLRQRQRWKPTRGWSSLRPLANGACPAYLISLEVN